MGFRILVIEAFNSPERICMFIDWNYCIRVWMTILEITVHVLFEISFSLILLQIEAFCIIYIIYIYVKNICSWKFFLFSQTSFHTQKLHSFIIELLPECTLRILWPYVLTFSSVLMMFSLDLVVLGYFCKYDVTTLTKLKYKNT